MATVKQLDLNNFRTAPGNKIFSGRPRGEEVRRKANIASIEREEDVSIIVLIPNDTFTVNLSFFLGLFGESLQQYGRPWFEQHYSFSGPQVQLDKMPYYIDQAEKDSIPLPRVT
jgi:hypothetical protein